MTLVYRAHLNSTEIGVSGKQSILMSFYLGVWDFAQSGRWEGSRSFVLFCLAITSPKTAAAWSCVACAWSGRLTEEVNGGWDCPLKGWRGCDYSIRRGVFFYQQGSIHWPSPAPLGAPFPNLCDK